MRRRRVVVVGGGNAGLCAAISARESGADVLVLDRNSREFSGGNSRFTGGTLRVVCETPEMARALVPDLSDADASTFGYYTAERYFDDWAKATRDRADPDQVETVIRGSFDTATWMCSLGVPMLPKYDAHGACVQVSGAGPGLLESLTAAALKAGVEIMYDTRARSLRMERGQVAGVWAECGPDTHDLDADAVVLASGGFQSSPEWRSRHLGPGWDLARVRGTWANTGDGHRMAFEHGVQAFGHWSGAHATPWDLNAPLFGDPNVGDMFKKHSYPLGIVVNVDGKRFVDEGSDLRSYTYARWGREILGQPGQVAWQIFDAKVADLLGQEYRVRHATRVRARSVDELARKLGEHDVNKAALLETLTTFNASVCTDRPFDPDVLDGRETDGLEVPKSNWSMTIDEPPFEAYPVTCGITFTFGGVRITPNAEVVRYDGTRAPGLYAAGEIVGGNFYFNYPAGTGLMCGAVFGRLAGRHAAEWAA